MPDSPSKLKMILLPVGVLGLAVAMTSWLIASRPSAQPRPPEERVWPVSVMTAERVDVTPRISTFGEVRAIREAELRALTEGRIVALNPDFRDGARLASGAELVTVDPVDYEHQLAAENADLDRAQATLAEFRRGDDESTVDYLELAYLRGNTHIGDEIPDRVFQSDQTDGNDGGRGQRRDANRPRN